ncbi:CDP-glycerol glycerophosphotransferase family protein [Jonesiaceae bacterium BS-20]|uniref:CDP-glycerol glycerophosphotransferase family protein n=1 Tax=Jonesiaceae bacterium BS-20 TaxID=3120821 RepID=A0AAU7DYZ7_9MICO
MAKILNMLSSKSEGLLTIASKLGFQPILATLLTLPVLLLSLPSRNIGFIWLALVPVAYIVFSMRASVRSLRQSQQSQRIEAGTFLVPRILIILAITLYGPVQGLSLWTLLSISIVALSMSCEVPIRNIEKRIEPVAVNLPLSKFINGPRIPSILTVLGSLAWIAIFLISTALLPQSPIIIAVLAGIQGLLTLAILLHYAFVYFKQQSQGKKLGNALSEYQPKFILHWDAPANTTYQITMWLPYLERVGVPFVVLVRNRINFDEVRHLTSRPVILRKSITSLDDVIVDSLKTILYVNTATVNNHLVRYTHLTHIQLNHGESDKAASYNPAFKVFTKNFVAGQAAIDRFTKNGVSTPLDFFEIVGRPQVENIHLVSNVDNTGQVKSILYAPTWHGFYEDSNYSSLSIGLVLVEEIHKAGHRVIFRPHPYSLRSARYRRDIAEIQAYLAQTNASEGSNHKFGPAAEQVGIVDLMNESTALISDVSSVVSDYLYSEKPFSVVCINQTLDALRSNMPLSDAAYVLDCASEDTGHKAKSVRVEVQTVLHGLLEDDTLQRSRLEFKKYYLGDIPYEERVTRFLTALNQYL